jgi:hypothetical protein
MPGWYRFVKDADKGKTNDSKELPTALQLKVYVFS